jgi:hypothetical protein
MDLFFGTVRILRATRRQRAVDPSGALVIETAAHYSRVCFEPSCHRCFCPSARLSGDSPLWTAKTNP